MSIKSSLDITKIKDRYTSEIIYELASNFTSVSFDGVKTFTYAGNQRNIKLGPVSDQTTYNGISLNGVISVAGGMTGLEAGATGDDVLYLLSAGAAVGWDGTSLTAQGPFDLGTLADPWRNAYTQNLYTSTHTPASAAATGIVGQIAWDASFIYICTATNTWKRVAIATW